MNSIDGDRLATGQPSPNLQSAWGANALAIMNLQGKRADAVWTQAEWTALCEHLQNDNVNTHFVMGFRDEDGCKRYVRSKRLGADRAISWAWSSIAGSPKSRLAFVPYSTNDGHQSRWGGLDFDAHHGETGRARELAFAAFRVLLNTPDLAVILETSGSGGWHVWAISPSFHDTREWVRMLKSIVTTIGTVIIAGVCEIFPPDSLPSRFGKGMRAPGCWNPGTDTNSEIVWENSRTSLGSVLSGKSKKGPLISKGLQTHFPDTKKETSFPSPSFSLYQQERLLHKLGITLTGTRNAQLASLVGEVFHQVGCEVARRLAAAQFQAKTVATAASESEHMASFETLWAGLVEKWKPTLSSPEREIFKQLDTENERDAFRIVRSYARKAKLDGVADFPIVRDNLGQRLGITGKGAAGVRDKLARLGAIEKTRAYVPNKSAARFKWLQAMAMGSINSPKTC